MRAEPVCGAAAPELGGKLPDCTEIPSQLDLDALRGALARPGPRLVRGRQDARLLEHPRILARIDHTSPFRCAFYYRPEDSTARLAKALRRAGVAENRLREAIVHEVAHLATTFSALADDPAPYLELSLSAGAEPGDGVAPLPAETRLALVWQLPLPGRPALPGVYVAARLPAVGRPLEPFPEVEPGGAVIVRLEPDAAPEEPRNHRPGGAPGGDGAPRLVLWLASSRSPQRLPADAEWTWPRPADDGRAAVLLVSMPFGPSNQPSLALGLLRSTLPPGAAEVLYLSLPFARRIGKPLYTWIAEFHPEITMLVGEWLFRAALFPEQPDDPRAFLQEILLARTQQWRTDAGEEPCFNTLVPDGLVADLLRVRSLVDGFVDACVEEVLARRPRIVGLTSVFQQHAASLALARRLKQRAPEIVVVLGGANCEGPMGVATVRNFPFLDAVVCGEGEIVFPQLVERLLAGRPVSDLQGVYTPGSPAVAARTNPPADAPSYRNLDDLPRPDFDDFFRQYEESGLAMRYPVRLPFETSRGCWWGEKQHCTFCGLNGTGMAFRSKSPERALAELKDLVRRYPGWPVSAADNILDVRYFKTFLPWLAEERLGLEIFYEVKANLKKEEIRRLRAAGVTAIQPGIESLSDEVLRLMRKGVSALQNVRLLKWCEELGVRPYWNLLWGFPGEPPEEYERIAELFPRLHHLPPPGGMAPIFLERFSPNHFQSEALGFCDVQPVPTYRHIYPFADGELADLAYFFSYGYQDGRDVLSYAVPLVKRIVEWQDAYDQCRLRMIDQGDYLLISDTRPQSGGVVSAIEGLAREIYLACDDVTTVDRLRRVASPHAGDLSLDAVEAAVGPLIDRGLLLRQGDSLLALATPGSLAAEGS